MQIKKPQYDLPFKWRGYGFTLVEILIAIIVIAIGLLGMAGLQVSTLRNNNSSSMRTQATYLAEDMADRIRMNQDAWDPDNDGNYSDSIYVGRNTDSVSNPGCIASGCTATELVNYDLFQWAYGSDGLDDNSDGVAALPSGRGEIQFVPNTGANPPYENTFRVIVMWDDERTGATGTTCPANPDPDTDLTCLYMEFRP